MDMNAEYRPLSFFDMYPFLVNSNGEVLREEINIIYKARKERKENLMDNRNFSVEQWLSGMISDRRFYPARSVRKYMEEQIDGKFIILPDFGDCILTPSGYHMTVSEEDKIVTVEVYDSADKLIFSEAWLLRK